MRFRKEENDAREIRNMAGASHVFSPENPIKKEAGGGQGGFYERKPYRIQLAFWSLKDEKLKCSLAF